LDGGFDFGFCAGGEAAFLKSGGGAQGREGDMDVLFFKHFEGCMGVGFVGWGDGEMGKGFGTEGSFGWS
jgi:hypothetical protein